MTVICMRCRRVAPPQGSEDFLDWEAYGVGPGVICPGCLTREEQEQIDEAMLRLLDKARHRLRFGPWDSPPVTGPRTRC